MGSLVQSLFGGSSSGNNAWAALSGPLTSMANTGATALNNLSSNLGSFQQYKDNSGYNAALNQGQVNTAGTNAARGLLNSGATGKALATFDSNLGQQSYNNYLGQLGTVASLGTGGAGAASSSGQSTSSSKGILNSLFG